MCNRYRLKAKPDELIDLFDLPQDIQIADVDRELFPGCHLPVNRLWATIHNVDPDDPRMVRFLLDKQSVNAWLDPGHPYENVPSLLRPAPHDAGWLTVHQIT